jgi:hypothetical protein
MQKYTYTALAAAVLLALTACGGSDSYTPPQAAPVVTPPPTPVASTISIDFSKGIDGWTPGVADYFDADEPSETGYGWSKLPPGTGLTGMGYYLTTHNNSDNVMTYVKHQYGGFVAGAKYNLTFSLTYATDASADCFGVGGSRGSSIYMVVAASGDEPKTVKQANGEYRMNLDRGNNAESGTQGKVLGVQGVEGLSCEGGAWTQATRKSDEAIAVTADKEGKLWVVLGTDSGFESTNALFLLSATVNVKPQ